ncbi:MAG: HAD family phosphatase [Burkholderiaceae bacterium]|jgi:putative hydrolase of the HAD superfamily|nr:HAD family phosphatase [Burkholderiaceae bacterium]
MRVVFDFAGVLFHWQPQHLVRRTLPQHATDEASARRLVDDIFQGYRGDWAEFDRGRIEVPALVRRIAARTGLPHGDVQAVVDAVPAELQPMPATVALLRRLHAQGRRLHFLSNMPAPYAEHLEREHDFLRCFESGVISARVQQIKPEPGIFDTAERLFGAEPAQLVFIDDMADNVHAARRAGWNALHFVDAADCEAQLRRQGWA